MTLQSFTSGNEFHFLTGMGSERNLSNKWKQGGEEMEGSYGYICGTAGKVHAVACCSRSGHRSATGSHLPEQQSHIHCSPLCLNSVVMGKSGLEAPSGFLSFISTINSI